MSVGTGFAATIITTPGYTLGGSENVNNAKLNQGFNPVIAIDDTQNPTPVVLVFNGVDLTKTGISATTSGFIIPIGKMFICTGGWGVIATLTGFSATGGVVLQLQDSAPNLMAQVVAGADSSGLGAVGRIFWITCDWPAGATVSGQVTARGVAGGVFVNVGTKNNSTTMTANIAFTGFLMNAV